MYLEEILIDHAFEILVRGLLERHSFRRDLTTLASKYEVTCDIVNGEGRWKRKKKQVDVYTNIWLPYSGALIDGKLCGPTGPCWCALRKLPGHDNDITNNIVWNHVTPEAKMQLGEEIALIYALSLLWSAHQHKYQKSQ